MDKRKKVLIITGAAVVLTLGGGGLAAASGAVGGDGGDGGDSKEAAVTGADADRAGKAAVDSLGGGTVVRVVQDGEGGVAYQVEVKKPDGTGAEVQITKDFTVAAGENGSGTEESGQGG